MIRSGIVAEILWSRLDTAGQDACRVEKFSHGFEITGAAIAREAAGLTCLHYRICHDPDWITRSVAVSGWCGARSLNLRIDHDESCGWTCNDAAVEAVEAATDIDLGFTAATNTSAICRLKLGVGQQKSCVAAWLDPADWKLKPLRQTYFRVSEDTYEYQAPDHDFRSRLTVNHFGLVTRYPGLWEAAV